MRLVPRNSDYILPVFLFSLIFLFSTLQLRETVFKFAKEHVYPIAAELDKTDNFVGMRVSMMNIQCIPEKKETKNY